MKNKTSLHYGFSTGACMSALAVGLWQYHNLKIIPNSCEIFFLDNIIESLPLITNELHKGFLKIKKNAGDDPDCTHNAILYATLKPCTLDIAQNEDYIININNIIFILHADNGIGLCTRQGLDCEQGKWAINTKPREMLIKNIQRQNIPYQHTIWLFSIGVENGQELAKKTLNNKLGIINGISILGTTGHVHPFSHNAYKKTIALCLNTLMLENHNTAVFSTGGRSMQTAKKIFHSLPEICFISIADFIGFSIETAKKYDISHLIIACMPGKLFKYASKQYYTHAHKEEQDLTLLKQKIQDILPSLHQSDYLDDSWLSANSVREALCSFTKQGQIHILENLTQSALQYFLRLYPRANFTILLCDFDGNKLLIKQHGVHNE